ncbi:hypothetical protein DAPPUDRAFT_112391 [Daphnia pulex]|uniref:BED-type domain-containing protein n=1 Tax=Daphnia pulex TaxID=6669 RepID=E9HBW7_DAPPU|nr:hypothetical protein DAPPUDRAFT_112391 [Daphnia pulex]|eukprot:EFX70791.1 hypothetical protein DAPPUDRAFT_112391 [Daphnia pulex]
MSETKKGRSPVWDHFKKVGSLGAKKCRCLHCEAILGFCGNTTNMLSHLSNHHQDIYLQVQPKLQKSRPKSAPTPKRPRLLDENGNETEACANEVDVEIHDVGSLSTPMDTDAPTSNERENGSTQASSSSSRGKFLPYPRNSEKMKNFLRQLMLVIVRGMYRISLVNNPFFIAFVRYLDPRIILPCRSTITHKHLPEIFKKLDLYFSSGVSSEAEKRTENHIVFSSEEKVKTVSKWQLNLCNKTSLQSGKDMMKLSPCQTPTLLTRTKPRSQQKNYDGKVVALFLDDNGERRLLSLLVSLSSPQNRRLNSTMGGGVLLEGGLAGPDFESSRSSRSAFQVGHFDFSNIHVGGLFGARMGSAFSVVMMGRWSLPEKGPMEEVAFRARRDKEMMRSIVEGVSDNGLTLVPGSFGVTIAASVITVQMDLPAVLSVLLDSHWLWWALKSPAIMILGEILGE